MVKKAKKNRFNIFVSSVEILKLILKFVSYKSFTYGHRA